MVSFHRLNTLFTQTSLFVATIFLNRTRVRKFSIIGKLHV